MIAEKSILLLLAMRLRHLLPTPTFQTSQLSIEGDPLQVSNQKSHVTRY